MGAPIPVNEAARLRALHAQRILDSAPERSFDDIAKLAQLICDVPIALVTMVDENRQWFKARIGLPLTETPRDQSFCAHALGARDPLIIHDTNDDPRFVDNPLVVGDPRIRSYAGIPIYVDDGEDAAAVGTLCVLDRVPRKLNEAQLAALAALARRVEMELRLRKQAITTRNEVGSSGRAHGPVAHPSRTDESKLGTGDVIAGRYQIEELIGSGGMGRVYRAKDTKATRRVAIKVMGSMAVSTGEAVERFVREARSLLRIESDHVARLLDAGNLDDGAPFLVMELLDGHDLGHEVAPMSADRAIALALQACDGLAAVHEAGIVHRDLKPGNVFLARSGGAVAVKLLDFGISKLTDTTQPPASGADGSLTAATALLGSPRYMSPEQLLSSRDVGTPTDIWALGVILYELLTNEHPFTGESITELCASIFTKPPRSMREHVPSICVQLDEIVLRCVAREASARWPSARALGEALAALAARSTTSGSGSR